MQDFDPDRLRGLETVRVSKGKVLDALRHNREDHRKLFEEAIDGWHKEVIRSLNNQLKLVKANKRHYPYWHLPMPEDHTNEYDQVIAMLEMSLDDEFVLTSKEFAQYVRDDWHWKGAFLATANSYTAGASA